MTKLYELTEAFKNIERIIEDTEEFSEVEQQQLLQAINRTVTRVEDKVEACIVMAKQFDSEEEIYSAEIKRLTQKKNAAKAKSEWLKGYLKENLIAMNINELKTRFFKVRIYNHGAGSVDVTDPKLVEDQFKEIVTEIKVDKKAILAHWLEQKQLEEETGKTAIVPAGVTINPPAKAMRIS